MSEPVLVNSVDGAEMILIPGGKFGIGCESEDGVHPAFLKPFYMARHAVTFAQFEKFLAASGHQPLGHWNRHYAEGREAYPVNNVCLYDALAYAGWAQAALPTEAQWERAARGDDGRAYPWGDRWDAERCNNWQATRTDAMLPILGARGTVPGGTLGDGASPYGVQDMAGNVMEWTGSVYREYPYEPWDQIDPPPVPEDLTPQMIYVLRGGAWNLNDHLHFRTTVRFWSCPLSWSMNRGFRITRPLSSKDSLRLSLDLIVGKP